MKLFVTGAAGFIGSHLLNVANRRGHQVVALRRSPDRQPRIPLEREPQWLDKEISALVESDFEGCDVLIHLAAHSAYHPYDTLENCILGNVIEPIGMFRKAAAGGLLNIVAAGTCFEYGAAGERLGRIPIDAPLEPTTSYPASKAAATVAFQSLVRELGASMKMLRIFQVYGPGEAEGRLWPSLRAAALSGNDLEMTPGDQIRDFVHVSVVAEAFVDAAEEKASPAGQVDIRHVGSGKAQTVADFARKIWQETAAKGELKLGALPPRPNEAKSFMPA
jgi:nucleoside-diphosphate-sugar epimerase